MDVHMRLDHLPQSTCVHLTSADLKPSWLNCLLGLLLLVVHVISAKHFTSGYQSEILHAVSVPSKLRNSTGRQPVNPQMRSGCSMPPPANMKYVNCYNF